MEAGLLGRLIEGKRRPYLVSGCKYVYRREEGNTLVEFTLILLVMLSLTFAMIDFSRALYAANVVQAAAQEGARAGIVNLASATTAALDKMAGLDTTQVQVAVTQPAADSVQVQVTYQFEFVTPFLATAIAGGGISLTGSARMMTR
jgi:Flp pilus assembly protein TadG